MLQPAHESFLTILEPSEPPCLSLYQPTHRRHPENQQDPIRFRNLVKALEGSLQRHYPDREVRPLLEPFAALAEDYEFWKHTLDGLAVLGARGVFRAYRLQRPVPELAIVADSFHVKPLLRIVQSADSYHVLGLSRQAIRLFEGNRDVLDEIEPAAGVPRTIADALGEELTEPHVTIASHRAGPSATATRYGLGSKKDEVAQDTERFFRAVDRAVLEKHSRPSQMPLILAALPEHQAVFRRVCHNPHLVAESVDIHPEALTLDALRERAWSVMASRYLARLDNLIGEFREGRTKGRGADDLAEVAAAAALGRVAVLLVEADRQIPGRLVGTSGQLEFAALDQPNVDDLLDDLCELVLAKKGQVVVVPGPSMPTHTGAAATFRF